MEIRSSRTGREGDGRPPASLAQLQHRQGPEIVGLSAPIRFDRGGRGGRAVDGRARRYRHWQIAKITMLASVSSGPNHWLDHCPIAYFAIDLSLCFAPCNHRENYA